MQGCKPLFPKLASGPNDSWVLHPDPEPTQVLISSMVVSALHMISFDCLTPLPLQGSAAAWAVDNQSTESAVDSLTVDNEAGVPEIIL